MGKTVFLNKSYEMRLMKYWERRTAPLRWAVMSLYVENLSDKAKSQAERNMPLAKAMAVNGMTARIMEPIWEKRRTREMLKNNNEEIEQKTEISHTMERKHIDKRSRQKGSNRLPTDD